MWEKKEFNLKYSDLDGMMRPFCIDSLGPILEYPAGLT